MWQKTIAEETVRDKAKAAIDTAHTVGHSRMFLDFHEAISNMFKILLAII